jgi:transposase, IS5 family
MNFAQLVVDGVCPSHKFLEEMEAVVPWGLFEAELRRRLVRKTGGRPPYCLLLLFRMHLLQVWFRLSDAQCEFQCNDRLSFRKFLGLEIEAKVPDSTTLEGFRHELAEHGEALFERLDAFFAEQGLLLKAGNVVDATFIKGNSRKRRDASQQRDSDAEAGHKGFGYSVTANVDVGSKLVRKLVITSARPHDSQMFLESLKGDERLVYADSAYEGHRHKLPGVKTRILYKRHRGKKGEPTPPLPPLQQRFNRLASKVRARGEHVFASWKTGLGGVVRAWYCGVQRVSQQFVSVALGANLKRYGFLTRG